MGCNSASTENIRRYIVSNPPCVIFALSIGIMAFGVLILAFKLNLEPINREAASEAISYCFASEKDSSLTVSTDAPYTTSMVIQVTAPIAVCVNGTSNVKGIGSITVGDLGLLPWDPDAFVNTWSYTLLVPGDSWTCTNELCQAMACLKLNANQHPQLPRTVPSMRCTDSRLHPNTTAPVVSVNLFQPDRKCPKRGLISMKLDQETKYAVVQLQRDTRMARLHLLYTSYFLFFTLVVVLIYAACSRKQTAAAVRAWAPLKNTNDI